MPGLFITATGTEIGKTYVAAGLLRAGRRAGLAMDAFKPVMSGYDERHAATSDAGLLLAALDRPVTAETVVAMAPWRFAAPLSPDMAAAAEGRRIAVADVVEACRARIAAEPLVLIEGVGGVMVPLDAHHTVLDLIAALAVPVLLVTGSYLGAISHCLTAVATLEARGMPPDLVILNETAGSPVPLADTSRTLQQFCPETAVITLPRTPGDHHTFDDLLTRVRAITSPSRARGSAA